MRDVPAIWEAWRSGVYIGATKPCTRVTVETNYWLRTTTPVLGAWTRGPARWWQRADASKQIETEVPNVLSVSMSRSLDADAANCDIIVANTMPPAFGEPESPEGQLGDLGHFTWDHGASQDGRARWGHVANSWNNVLVPNALIRTYQGFGGHDKTIDEAVADGNIILNGVWLVDQVAVSTDGTLTLTCRDMAKLVIDQFLAPPLVPAELYPVTYRRWELKDFEISADGAPCSGQVHQPSIYGGYPGPHSSTDITYGQYDSARTGRRPSEAFDMSTDPGPLNVPGTIAHQRSYWLSEPKGARGDSVWIEFATLDNWVNSIYFHAWAGNYVVMVSIEEAGEWVPPEFGGQGGMTPNGIPYVSTFTPVWEGGQPPAVHSNLYKLPRTYKATRIRLTITNLVSAAEGGFRAGARKIIAVYDCANETPYVFAGAALPVNTSDRIGYWQVRANGRVFAFGDARTYPTTSPQQFHNNLVVGMSAHPSGTGYWTIDTTGRVLSYGTAEHFGDDEAVGRNDVVDLAPSPNGDGYWILHKNGNISTYGDAQDFGDLTVSGTMPSGAPILARSIESHPSDQGYWVLRSDGIVTAFGDCDHFGNANRDGFTQSEYVASLRRTSTGGGYWITSGSGKVQNFGDAGDLGDGIAFLPTEWPTGLCWDLIPSQRDNNGYAVQHANGKLDPHGSFRPHYGDVSAKTGQTRVDGNYKDYVDIIRDLLLWAGFYLNGDDAGTGMPPVYGNLESTGAYAESDLPREMFDRVSILDAIRAIKEIVGYVFWIDQEGGARFESPNFWAMGNYLIDGTPSTLIPEIDEKVNLTGHAITRTATDMRSEITIANQDPLPKKPGEPAPKGIVVTRIAPPGAADLRGIISPAMWHNGAFLNKDEQRLMAELIGMHIWFSRRTAQVQCVNNPLIDINDQVRVFERQTGETYVHYVRGIESSHDLVTGDFTMSLTTNWLGGTPIGSSGLFFACAMRPQLDGYWQCSGTGAVHAFGAAQTYQRNEPTPHSDWVVAIRPTKDGKGYWTIDASGGVRTYGNAYNYGGYHRYDKSVVDMAITPSGNGYWILLANGFVYASGDAADIGTATVTGRLPSGSLVKAQSIETHPTLFGFWVMLSDGTVQAFGDLPNHGSANRDDYRPHEYTSCLRRTPSGDGYYITSGGGIVQAFGGATGAGAVPRYPDSDWVQGLVWDMLVDNDGYALQHADGKLEAVDSRTWVFVNTQRAEDVNWAIRASDTAEESGAAAAAAESAAASAATVSVAVMQFLANTESAAAVNAVANKFGSTEVPAIKGPTE